MNDIEKALERLKKADSLPKEDREAFLFEYLELQCVSHYKLPDDVLWELISKAIVFAENNNRISSKNLIVLVDKLENAHKRGVIANDLVFYLLAYIFVKNN